MTDRGSLFINTAIDMLADCADQGDAAGVGLIGAAHHAAEIVELFGEFDRDRSAGIVGLGPVKRCSVQGTAGPAGDTRIIVFCFHVTTSGTSAALRIKKERPERREHPKSLSLTLHYYYNPKIQKSSGKIQKKKSGFLCRLLINNRGRIRIGKLF